jgi:4-hydroxythreonine-4-phosphate dehydrogenase
MTPSIIAITMGDPGGIGPEVIVKALRKIKIPGNFRFVVFGSEDVFIKLRKKTRLSFPFQRLNGLDISILKKGAVGFLDISDEAVKILNFQRKAKMGHFLKNDDAVTLNFEIGKISKVNAAMTLAALAKAADYAVRGQVAAIATAPLNKEALRLLAPDFKGHTEYLAQAAGRKEYAMMFVSKRLKVTLVTLHVPLKKVSELLNRDLIASKIRLTHEFLKKYLGIPRPEIAVCALNPHGKETGEEEEKVIVPAVKAMRKKGIRVLGPFASDVLFHHAWCGQHDAIVSMYHDQALGPFKMMAFHDGVNVTAGLPFVRTSPDHGTAFDIAWKGVAEPTSMMTSIQLACRFVANNRK